MNNPREIVGTLARPGLAASYRGANRQRATRRVTTCLSPANVRLMVERGLVIVIPNPHRAPPGHGS